MIVQKTFSELQFCGQKPLGIEGGQRTPFSSPRHFCPHNWCSVMFLGQRGFGQLVGVGKKGYRNSNNQYSQLYGAEKQLNLDLQMDELQQQKTRLGSCKPRLES